MGQSSPGRWPRVAATAMFAAIPALGLVWFAPSASMALSSTGPAPDVAALDLAQIDDAETELPGLDLSQWEDTQLGRDLVAIARRQSRSLNTALRQLRSQLRGLTPGTFDYQIVLQRLLLIARQRDAWDLNWRRIGRPGVNLNFIQNNLVELQDRFIASNAQLQTLQAQEIQTGSIANFTPPRF